MALKLGVLISGSGTNLQAIIDCIAAGTLDATVEVVVSSRPDAYGLQRAKEAGIPTVSLSRDVYEDPMMADAAIAQVLKKYGVEYVAMAGYMRKCTPVLLESFPDRVVNLHPALLPSFVGAHAIADAINHGSKVTGVTVHFANLNYDEGPIIAQQAVVIEEGDSEETLAPRIHDVEHVLYPATLQLIAEGRVHIVTNEAGRRVTVIDPK